MALDFTHWAMKRLGLQPHELAESERKALERAPRKRRHIIDRDPPT